MTWYRSAVAPGVTHLRMIRMTRYPNSEPRKRTCGTNSHQMLSQSRVWRKFRRDMKMPSIICVTPMTMLIFILSEFRNGSSVFVPCQMGSTPNAYGAPGWTRPAV